MSKKTLGSMIWPFLRSLLVIGPLILMLAVNSEARVRRAGHHRGEGHYSQRGFALAVGFGSVGLDTELPGLTQERSGPGVVLGLSYGLSNSVTLFGTLTGSGFDDGRNHDWAADWSVGYADIGVKVSLVSGPHARTQPYVSAAIGGAVLSDEQGREYEGSALRLAGGIDHFISPHAIIFIEAGF